MTNKVIRTTDFAHILQEDEEGAIHAALAANRPLLVRGEPGVGKTQLARAAAIHLNRPLVSMTVDAHTEPREIVWTFDAVQRLAEAQVASVVEKDTAKLREMIDMRKFVRPGPIWWAYSWDTAQKQLRENEPAPVCPKGWNSRDGVVILIDEIDKAESEVPNGLLEALGSRQFLPQGWNNPIVQNAEAAAPLIIITTNEERSMPNAFIRRCFVLHLELPLISPREPANTDDRRADQQFVEFICARGQSHFPQVDDGLLRDAASLLLTDRRYALQNHLLPLPGQAEYLDFVRAVVAMLGDASDRDKLFEQVRSYTFRKSRRPVR
ncbi:MAG: MoxR family ATPase [Planctomycetia bacterium]